MKKAAMQKATAFALLLAAVIGLAACGSRNPLDEDPVQSADDPGGYLGSLTGSLVRESEPGGGGAWTLVQASHTVAESSHDDVGSGDYYKYTHSYEGIADGRVRFKTAGGRYSASGTGDDYRDNYFECTQPADLIAPGEEVTLSVRVYTENVVLSPSGSGTYRTEFVYLDIGKPDAVGGDDRYGSFCDPLGFNAIYCYGDGGCPVDETMDVSVLMPGSASSGDRVSIYFRTELGSIYEWQYEFAADASSPSSGWAASVAGSTSETHGSFASPEVTASANPEPGPETAAEVPYKNPAHFEPTHDSTLADFQWFSQVLLDGVLPDGAERMTELAYVTGGWKGYLYDDLYDQYGGSMERFVSVYINDDRGRTELVIKWSYVCDGSTGEGFEEDSPDSIFTGTWSGGQLEALGPGKITVTDFYYLNDREYAIGTLIWPDGMPSLVMLVRP